MTTGCGAVTNVPVLKQAIGSIHSLDPGISDQAGDYILRMDCNYDQYVSYAEYMSSDFSISNGAADPANPAIRKKAFALADKDRSGNLTTVEMFNLLRFLRFEGYGYGMFNYGCRRSR